jgi:Flp pilus assembly protein TadD
MGRLGEAIPHLRQAVEHDPENTLARSNLGLALSETGKVEEAIPHMQQAAKLSGGQDPMILSFLGELYAKAGRVPQAVEVTRQAMAVATQARDAQLVAELQARIAAYESRR